MGILKVKRKVAPVQAEILEATEDIQTTRKTLADFERDWLLKLAVQRALEIVSEASRHIPDQLLVIAPDRHRVNPSAAQKQPPCCGN
ncbi:HepT-like ribonuclease domain-containing protein [Rhizobium sp. RM]|uniref:HepT-like ribonuclease domain-containing protein n=1 Tax=Rhizobium sp. RM TaxID=2748079 RepID=UPI003365331C